MFISFEGLDFCGKSTQVALLKKYFEDLEYEVNTVREPGGVAISEQIREVLLSTANTTMDDKTEALLFAASRSQLVEEKIKPLIRSGSIVMADRYLDSSIAYQGYGRGLDVDALEDLQLFAVGDMVPEITLFIDIPIVEMLKRMAVAENVTLDRIEVTDKAFFEKVREGYLKLARRHDRFKIIDGTLSIEEIHRSIVDHVLQVQ